MAAASGLRASGSSHGLQLFADGLRVWVENPYEEGDGEYRSGWLPASVSARPKYVPAVVRQRDGAKGLVRAETLLSPAQVVEGPPERFLAMNDELRAADVNDLPQMHEPALLFNTIARFNHGEVYTRAGQILISVNPYREPEVDGLPLYGHAMLESYRRLPASADPAVQPPHIWQVAHEAYQTLVRDGVPQSILISGESGAGKTEATKLVLQYLAHASSKRVAEFGDDTGAGAVAGGGSPVETRLLEANRVLEAFGNASTVRNFNSSRFGKFASVWLNPGGGIDGCTVATYLLEKSRLVTQMPGERNFHVFYHLLAGAAEDESRRLSLQAVTEYHYLQQEAAVDDAEDGSMSCTTWAGDMDDKSMFVQLKEAMGACGMSRIDVSNVFRMVSGILLLGNVRFLKPDKEGTPPQWKEGGPMSRVAKLLGLEESAIGAALTTKTTSAGGRSSVASSALTIEEASLARDALAKLLYDSLFTWIVAAVNNNLANPDVPRDVDPSLSIGILDIFGFEVFDVNVFEQLCINYANEKLHQVFIHHVFKLEEALYKSEGIDFSTVHFSDNTDIIRLIEDKPMGIFSLLDESCLFPRSTDKSFVMKMDTQLKRNASYSPGPRRASTLARRSSVSSVAAKASEPGSFMVRHFAADVTYAAGGFLDKNRDHVLPELATVCRSSSLSIVRESVSVSVTAASGATAGRMTGSAAFLGSKFKDDMNRLIRRISQTHPHFVKCIKPNLMKRPLYVQPEVLQAQFRYLGIIDAIRINHAGFSHRSRYPMFYERYVALSSTMAKKHGLLASPDRSPAQCRELLKLLWATTMPVRLRARAEGSLVQFGATRIFMKREMYQALEALRAGAIADMDKAAVAIQNQFRGHYNRQTYGRVKDGVLSLQKHYRARGPRNEFLAKREAAVRLERFYKTRAQRLDFINLQLLATRLQRLWRFYWSRVKLVESRVVLLHVHTLARSLLLRKRLLRRMESLLVIQRFVRDFLVRNRIYWSRVHAALLFQAVWRGYSVRHFRPDIVEFMNEFRRRQARTRFFHLTAARWRGRLVRERYLMMRGAALHIQRWTHTRNARQEFLRQKTAATRIQAMSRGRTARRDVGEIMARKVAADEATEIKRVRGIELESLDAMVDRMAKPEYHRPLSEIKPAFHQLIDLDILVDISDIYMAGWSKQLLRLERAGLAAGEHTADIAIGSAHSVIVNNLGKPSSWGWGDRGQLGHGDTESSERPRPIADLFQRSGGAKVRVGGWGPSLIISQVSAGADHTLAVSADGKVFSWGANSRGQLGLGHTDAALSPQPVVGVSRRVAEVAAGAYHSALLTAFGSVYTFGDGSRCGQGIDRTGERNGKASHADILVPTAVKTLSRFSMKSVQCGWSHTIALSTTGDMFSWGDNAKGQLGLGSTKSRLMPALIQPPRAPSALDIEPDHHSVASSSRRESYGQVGQQIGGGVDELIDDEEESVRSAGRRHSQFFALQGGLLPGDRGMDARLDAESTAGSEATSLQAYSQKPYIISEVRAGANHNIALSITGRVYTWGANQSGQLGLGDRLPRYYPSRVSGALRHKRVVSVAAGWRSTAALTKEHELFGWGRVGGKWAADRGRDAQKLQRAAERGARREGRSGYDTGSRRPSTVSTLSVPLTEVLGRLPADLLEPAARRVRGCEGYMPLRVECSWSSSMAALSVYFKPEKSTTAMVAATEAKVSKVRAQLDALGPEAHLSDLDDSDEEDKMLSIKAIQEAEDLTGAYATTAASALKLDDAKLARVIEQREAEREKRAKALAEMRSPRKITISKATWARSSPAERLLELGVTDAKMRLMDPSSLAALRATVRSGKPTAMKAAVMVAENLERRQKGARAVYQNPGGMSDQQYQAATKDRERAWLANTAGSRHRVVKRDQADRMVSTGKVADAKRDQRKTKGGIATSSMPVLSFNTELVDNPLSSTGDKAAVTAVHMARTARELTSFDKSQVARRRARKGGDNMSVGTTATQASVYTKALRMVETGVADDIETALARVGAASVVASSTFGGSTVEQAGRIGNTHNDAIGASGEMYKKLLVAGGEWDEWQMQAEQQAREDLLDAKREEAARRRKKKAALDAVERVEKKTAGPTHLLDHFSPEVLVATRNEDVSIQDIRRKKEEARRKASEPVPTVRKHEDAVDLYRRLNKDVGEHTGHRMAGSAAPPTRSAPRPPPADAAPPPPGHYGPPAGYGATYDRPPAGVHHRGPAASRGVFDRAPPRREPTGRHPVDRHPLGQRSAQRPTSSRRPTSQHRGHERGYRRVEGDLALERNLRKAGPSTVRWDTSGRAGPTAGAVPSVGANPPYGYSAHADPYTAPPPPPAAPPAPPRQYRR